MNKKLNNRVKNFLNRKSRREVEEKSIYNENLYKQLKNILKNPEGFKKSNKLRRKMVREKLRKLSVLIGYTDIFDKKMYKLENTEKELENFSKEYNKQLLKNIERKDSGLMLNQFKKVIESVNSYLFEKGYTEKYVDYKSVIDKISIDEVFYKLLINTTVNLLVHFNIKSNNTFVDTDIKEYEIILTTLHREVLKKLIMLIAIKLLDNNIQASDAISEMYDEIHIFLDDIKKLSYDNLAYQLLEIYLESINAKTRTLVVTKPKLKNLRLISLPRKFNGKIISPSHLPEITTIETDFENKFDLINFSKKKKGGMSTLNLGSKTKKALNISQKKEFKINENCIKLFEEIDKLPDHVVKNLDCLPFVPLSYLRSMDYEIEILDSENLSKEEDLITVYFKKRWEINKERKIKGEKKIYVDSLYDHILEIMNDYIISKECCVYKLKKALKKRDLKKEYKLKIRLRRVHNTIIRFAKIFNKFPIYFQESFDFRLRMYTYSFMFSRTTGIHKYLVMDMKEKKLTKKGFRTMLKAFYNDSSDKIDEINMIKSHDELVKWNKNNININIEDMINYKSPIYKILLNMEIKQLEKNDYKTSFMIEVDQRSSSLVYSSIVYSDMNLAKLSNVLSKDKTYDVPTIVMEEAKSYLYKKISNESYEIFTTSRLLNKKLIMCYFYGHTYIGRLNEIENFIENNEDAKYIAKNYTNLIDQLFPNLKRKQRKIKDIINFYIRNKDGAINIRTLDGSSVSWLIFKAKEKEISRKHKSVYNENEYKSYKAFKNLEEKGRTNFTKIVSSFLASYIHSIDGAMMRIFILKIYEKTKYIISHLHDSLQFHPNYYEDVMDIISEVFTSDILKNVIEKTLFCNVRTLETEDDRNIIEKKIKDFNKIKDDVVISKESFNKEGVFKFE